MSAEVLVTDDNDELRHLISFHLETGGYDVTTAPDGETCWERLQETESAPDLLLLDVMMPGIDGFQVLQRVRKHENDSLAELPIVMLTARGTEADVVRGLDIGATDYLTKPFRSQELLARVRRHLR